VFLYLFSLCGGKYKFFWLSRKKEERDEKSEKSACPCLCVFSLRANFFSSDEKRANEKKQTRKKLLKIVQTTTCRRKNLYHLPLAVPKNAQEEALGSEIASETLLDSERRGGASS